MERDFTLIIVLTTVGFFSLAFVLLYPIYRFMRREERAAEGWTQRAIAERQRREAHGGDGAPAEPPPPGGPA